MQSGSTPQVEDKFGDLQTPNIEDEKLNLEDLVQQGVLTPEEAQTVNLGPSAMSGVSLDPNLKKAQMDALSELQGITEGGGLNASDRANLNKISSDEATQSRGAREAILNHAQARGAGGSGLELLAQLQNQQDSATRQSQRDMDVSAQAQQRALQALMSQGQLAGNIENQSFNQQSQVAGANDAISKFNAQNQQNQINQNVQARNAAQTANLGEKQRVADANVGTANTQQTTNKSLIQQQYENELKKRQGQAGIAQTNAANAGSDSQKQADRTNQLIGAGIGAGASIYGAKK